MSEYTAEVRWMRAPDERYTDGRYSRAHEWRFDGGAVVAASSSPHVVPLPWSAEQNVDPEEAFVAALSSCHMLFFLSFAAKRRFVVDSYVDHAVGVMEKGPDGRMSITHVTLRPAVTFSGAALPSEDDIAHLHHQSHEACFIANSVKTEIVVEAAPAG